MKINFDPKHDIMRIKFQDGKYEISKELEEGIIVDVTKNNEIIAIEIMDVSKRIPRKNLKDVAISISE